LAVVSADVSRRPSRAVKRRAPKRSRTTLAGYTLAAAAVWGGWLATRAHVLVDSGRGLGYALGIIGASLMAILLLYPLRKRVRLLRVLGPTKHWFRMHMLFGVLGPILILYHCNFSLGSVNSNVALFCTLLVAGSGLVGRYLYAKIHVGLYGHKATLKELSERARISAEQKTQTAALVPELLERMSAFDQLVLKPPQSLLAHLALPLKLSITTRWAGWRLARFARLRLREQARRSPTVAAEHRRLRKTTVRFIKEHFRRVRRVAELGSYERMFSLWHVFHLPFFYMLVLTALLHVVAVHMYRY
jgi:hypothetical protein